MGVKIHFLPRILSKLRQTAISKIGLGLLIHFPICVPKCEARASLFGETGGLLRGLSRRFAKSFLASIAGCLEASGSASGTRAKNIRPQKRRAAASGR
jgi:hypothetical protein